jgi:hypothetical protein
LISSNPIRILKKLDSHLRKSIELVVYGKSALYLLFPNDNQIRVTNDVDLIVPKVQEGFLAKTNY